MRKIEVFLSAATFIAAPYMFLKIDSVNFTLFDFLLLLLALLTLFKDYHFNKKNKFYYTFVVFFLSVSVVSIYKTPEPYTAILATLQYGFIFLILFPTIQKILSYELYKKYIFIMCIFWSAFSIFSLTLMSNPTYYYGDRFIGLFSKPTEMGFISLLMTLFLIYSIGLTIKVKGIKGFALKILILSGFLANIYILLASGGRSALISLVFGMLLLLVLRFGISLKFIAITLIIFLVGVASINMLSDERNSVSRLTQNENIDVRIQDYSKSFEVLSEEFFIGTGLQTSGSLIIDVGGDHRPHNFFIDFLLETGFVGLLTIIGILYLSLNWGLKLLMQVLFKSKKADLLVASTIRQGLLFYCINNSRLFLSIAYIG